MAKLTDTQLIVLSRAAAHDGGIASIPDKMTKSAAAKVGACLVGRKLMREAKSKPGMPVWREDADGRPISLVITRAGRNAIGVEGSTENDMSSASAPEKPAQRLTPASKKGIVTETPPGSSTKSSPRAGSKQALVIEMLSATTGTTLDALVDATGWLPHTTRAALTGLRKRGYPMVRRRVDGKPSLYRIDRNNAATRA